MAEQNAYAVLGIRKGSTDQQLKQAYVSLVKKYNPDQNPEHSQRFDQIQKAYERLQDPEQRAKEDAFTFNYVEPAFDWAEDERTEEDEAAIEERIQRLQASIERGNDEPQTRQQLTHGYQHLSYQHIHKKQWTEAVGDWLTLLKIDPTHQRAKNNLINAYRYLGYYYALHELMEDAVRMWENALKMDPDSTETIHNLALVADKLGDSEKSRRYWNETIKRWKEQLDEDPGNTYLQQCLVEVHRHHGGKALERVQTPETKEQAIDSYRSVLRINPDDYDAQYNLAVALMEERNFEEAIQLLRKLQAEHPRNLDVVNQLGWGFLNSGKFELAFTTWRRGMAADPNNYGIKDSIVRARMAVGKKLKDSGHYTQALVHFKELIKLMPNAWEVYLEIADTMLRKGDRRSALTAYQKVIELDPKNKQAKRGISEIRMKS
jgi:tetratricopeptide (TPR) repeat protein